MKKLTITTNDASKTTIIGGEEPARQAVPADPQKKNKPAAPAAADPALPAEGGTEPC